MKKLKKSKSCRNTLRPSFERFAYLTRLRNVSDICHTAHQDRLIRWISEESEKMDMVELYDWYQKRFWGWLGVLNARTTSLKCFCKVLKSFTFYVNFFFDFQISMFHIFEKRWIFDIDRCSWHQKIVRTNDLVVFDGSSYIAARDFEVFEWFADWNQVWIMLKCKKNHKSHISEIASKNRYLRVKIDVYEITRKIIILFRNTLRRSYEVLACINNSLKSICWIFAPVLYFRRYLRVKKKMRKIRKISTLLKNTFLSTY